MALLTESRHGAQARSRLLITDVDDALAPADSALVCETCLILPIRIPKPRSTRDLKPTDLSLPKN